MSQDSTQLKYISRIDTNDTHGWYVRIKKENLSFHKLFSDKKLGNKDWALIQAMIYSGECIEKIESEFGQEKSVKMKRLTKYSRGYSYDVFEVAWTFRNQIKKKSFALKKYGEDNAQIKAERWANNVKKQLSIRD